MAHLDQRRPQNVSGDFYVDSSCIDCDTCRWMVPEVFWSAGEQSAVYHQPTNEKERMRSLQALLACPTASIGTIEKPKDIKQAQQSFPIPVAENVYHCGYHAENSYGAASYLIQHPEGNILVDSPRFAPPLVKRLEEMGGIRYMYLTHRDDVADHQKYAQHFECERILHQDDVNNGTRDVEIQLTGNQPYQLTSELLIIPVPGHSKGHTVLLYGVAELGYEICRGKRTVVAPPLTGWCASRSASATGTRSCIVRRHYPYKQIILSFSNARISLTTVRTLFFY